jgi:hypothetical protein
MSDTEIVPIWQHRAAIERLSRKVVELQRELEVQKEANEAMHRWIDDLQSGMFINCVYCGHRFGPDPGTPVSMADILKEHVELCTKHPMVELKKQLHTAKSTAGSYRYERDRLCRQLDETHALLIDEMARNDKKSPSI